MSLLPPLLPQHRSQTSPPRTWVRSCSSSKNPQWNKNQSPSGHPGPADLTPWDLPSHSPSPALCASLPRPCPFSLCMQCCSPGVCRLYPLGLYWRVPSRLIYLYCLPLVLHFLSQWTFLCMATAVDIFFLLNYLSPLGRIWAPCR